MVTEDRDLVLLRGSREVARITPGDVPATQGPTLRTAGVAQFGEGGPLLELADDVALDSVLLQVDTGMAHVEWSAIGIGLMLELPVGVLLVPAAPGDVDPYFELHTPDGQDEFISFMPRHVQADDVVIKPAPYQRVVNEGVVDDIKFTECAYERDGQQWRQLFYAVPFEGGGTVVVRAQASEPRVDFLFEAAKAAASTIVPLR